MGLWGVFVLYGIVSFVATLYGVFYLKPTKEEDEVTKTETNGPEFEAGGGGTPVSL
jgi:hypothetical protein